MAAKVAGLLLDGGNGREVAVVVATPVGAASTVAVEGAVEGASMFGGGGVAGVSTVAVVVAMPVGAASTVAVEGSVAAASMFGAGNGEGVAGASTVAVVTGGAAGVSHSMGTSGSGGGGGLA